MRGGGQWPTMRPASASALLSFGYLSDHANVFNSSGSTFPAARAATLHHCSRLNHLHLSPQPPPSLNILTIVFH